MVRSDQFDHLEPMPTRLAFLALQSNSILEFTHCSCLVLGRCSY